MPFRTAEATSTRKLSQSKSAAKSTLARKLRFIQNADARTQDRLMAMYNGLGKSYVKQQLALS